MTIVCALCREPLDPRDWGVYRRVTGWERKGIGNSRRSGSDIVLREPLDEFAHPYCVDRARDGVHFAQERLI
jgi:hypothetical protein